MDKLLLLKYRGHRLPSSGLAAPDLPWKSPEKMAWLPSVPNRRTIARERTVATKERDEREIEGAHVPS
jgi:hypothetical protein